MTAEPERVTHLLLVPSSVSDLRMYCGLRAIGAEPHHHIAGRAELITCKDCLANARVAFEHLSKVLLGPRRNDG